MLREAFAAHGGVEVDTQGDAFFYRLRARVGCAGGGGGGPAGAGRRAGARAHGRAHGRADRDRGGLRRCGRASGRARRWAQATAARCSSRRRRRGSWTARPARPGRAPAEGSRAAGAALPARRGAFPPLKTLNSTNLPLPQTPLARAREGARGRAARCACERARLVTRDRARAGSARRGFAFEAAHEAGRALPARRLVLGADLQALRDPALVEPTIAATLGAEERARRARGRQTSCSSCSTTSSRSSSGAHRRAARGAAPNVQAARDEPGAAARVDGERRVPVRPARRRRGGRAVLRARRGGRSRLRRAWRRGGDLSSVSTGFRSRIELAAARVTAARAAELLARLEQRLPLLTCRARDVPDRQRTLRAAIEWSYELLDDDEKRLFARLSVFAGGWTLEVG